MSSEFMLYTVLVVAAGIIVATLIKNRRDKKKRVPGGAQEHRVKPPTIER